MRASPLPLPKKIRKKKKNTFSSRCGQIQNKTKIQNLILKNKESTAKDILFEWSHHTNFTQTLKLKLHDYITCK